MNHSSGSLPAQRQPPAVPLRKTTLPLHQIKVGNAIMFAESCPLPQLRARKCPVRGIRIYRFGKDIVKSYQFSVEGADNFSMAIAEDADGHYLAISRQLDESEQDQWFGRDALGFFMEESTAKTIRCKIDRVIEAAWAGERYIKSVDWIPGALLGEGKNESAFHYNLLVNETGEKALEIEHYDMVDHSNVFITVYRPIDDILTIAEAIPSIPMPHQNRRAPSPAPAPIVQETIQKQRPDFRRVSEESIYIPASPPMVQVATTPVMEETPLPSFLMSRENEQYISLDEIIPPEPERVRCSTRAAKAIIDVSLERGVRVRDVLRDLLGLESAMSEEVIFELPLTDKDYRTLAQRYKLRTDSREEIRARLQEELRKKLLS